MSTLQTKAPTKKAFHFPKSAGGKTQAKAKVEAVDGTTAEAKPATAPETSNKLKASKKPVAQAASVKTARKTAARKTSATAPKQTPAVEAEAKQNAVKAPPKTEARPKRVKKEKVVRDSFTMPKSEYAKIAALKEKCQKSGVRVKKSELLRAAIAMLEAAPEKRLIAAIKALETVKTGRPSNG
ncbi:hypothetical protein QCE63_06520 [Caballeronia sp. LZ065]|nr:hypothetical protein [Caballeronia sp. LZ065]